MREEEISIALSCAAILVVLAAAVSAAISIYHNGRIVETGKIDVRFEVSDKAGFDLNGSLLQYGKMIPGTSQTRKVNVSNAHKFPISVVFRASESLEGLIFFESPSEKIGPEQSIAVPFTLRIPAGMPAGNYSGEIFADMMK